MKVKERKFTKMKVDPLRFPVFLQVSYTNTKPRASAIRGKMALLKSFDKLRIKNENEVNTSFHKKRKKQIAYPSSKR
jgi:hypothetical protein